MPNFYIRPSPGTQNPLLGPAELYTRLEGIRSNREIAKGQQDIARQRLGLEKRRTEVEYGTPGSRPGAPGTQGLLQRRMGLAEREMKLREQESARAARDQRVSNQDFDRTTIAPFRAVVDKKGLGSAFKPVFDAMDAIADNPEFTKGATYLHFKSNWKVYRDTLVEGLAKEAAKLDKTNPAKAQAVRTAMEQIAQDNEGAIVDQMMPATARALQPEAGKEPKLYETTEGYLPAEQAIGKLKPTKGMIIRQTPEGGFEMIQGANLGPGATALPPTTTTQSKIQANIVETDQALDRVANAIAQWKPQFNTLPFRAGVEWENLKQIMGQNPDPETEQKLRDFKSWHKFAMRDYALAIQELGKGNLTKNEEQLYGAGLPDPGKGIWPKEAPGVYKDALIQRYQGLKAIRARYNYYLNNGMSEQQYHTLIRENRVVSAKQIEDIIDQKGNELEQFYQSQGMSAQDVEKKVAQDLSNIFGIRF